MSTASEIENLIGATVPTKTICHVYAVGGNSIAMGKLQVNSDVSGDPGLSPANKAKYWDATHTNIWRLSNRFQAYAAPDKQANKYNMKWVGSSDEPFSYGSLEPSSQYSAGMIIFPKLKELYNNTVDIAYCQVHSLGIGFTQTAYDNFNLNTADPVYLSKNLTKILGRDLDLTVKHMEAMGYEVQVKGILMIGQGVADCWDLRNNNITIPNLTTAITEVINYFRTTLGYTDVPFYICQTTQTTAYAAEAADYENIISEINTTLGGVYMHYPKLWTTLVDGTHINGLTGVDAWGEGAEINGNKNMAELMYQVETASAPNGNCSGLGITVISGGSLQLDWTNGSTDEDGISIERSLNGTSWTEVIVTASGIETFTDTDLLRNTLYYYRVRAKRGYLYSDYSNTDSDTTANTGPDGSVTSLVLTTIDEVSIKIDWTNGSTDEDGISIERSLNGTSWAEIHVTVAGVATYTDTGLSPSTHYYYQARAVKSGDYSNYSNTANDYTATKAIVTSMNAGTATATFSLTVSSDVVMTLDGVGKFYSDSAGTLDESATWTATSGALRTRYIKVTSGTSNLLIFSKNSFSGIAGWTTTTQSPSFYTDTATLPRSVTSLVINGSNTIGGAIADLPPNLATLYLGGQNIISGYMSDLPLTMTYFRVTGQNRISEYISDHVWNNSINFILLNQAATYGFSQSEMISLIIDLDIPAWAGASRTLSLGANNASLVDTTQDGIWGDFTTVATPSTLAIALKSIVKVKLVTFTSTGITIPGGTGDGAGFPANFGDWWRI